MTEERRPPQSRRKRRIHVITNSDSDSDEENEIRRRGSRHQVDINGGCVFKEKLCASLDRDDSRTRMVKAENDEPLVIDIVESEPETQEMVVDKKEKRKKKFMKYFGSDSEDEITSYIVFKKMEKSVCNLQKSPNPPCGSSDMEFASEMPNYTSQDSRLKASPSVGSKVLTDGQICETIPVTDKPEYAKIAINGQLNTHFGRDAVVLVDSPPEVSGSNEEGRFTFMPVSEPGFEKIFEENFVQGAIKDKKPNSLDSEIQEVERECKEEDHFRNKQEATVSSSGLPASSPVSASPSTDISKMDLIRVTEKRGLGISENWDKHNKSVDQNIDESRELHDYMQSCEEIKQSIPEDIRKHMDYVCSRFVMLLEDSRGNRGKLEKYEANKPSGILEEYKKVIKKRIDDMIDMTARCISKKVLLIEEYLGKEECVYGMLMTLLISAHPSVLDDFAFSCRIVKSTYWLARRANGERSEPQTRPKEDSFPSLGLFSLVHPLGSKPHMPVNTESSRILPNTLQKQNTAASISTVVPQRYTVLSAPVQHDNELTVSNHATVAESSVEVQRSAHPQQYPPPPQYHQTAPSTDNEERQVLQGHLQPHVQHAPHFQQQQVPECLPRQSVHCQLCVQLPNLHESVPRQKRCQQSSQQCCCCCCCHSSVVVNSSQQHLQHQAESEEMQRLQSSQRESHQQTQQLLQLQQFLQQQTLMQHWQLQEQAPKFRIPQPQYLTQSQAQHLHQPQQLVQQHLQLQQQLQQGQPQFLLQQQIHQQPQLQQPQAQQQDQLQSQVQQPTQLGQAHAAHLQAPLEQPQQQMLQQAQVEQSQQQLQQPTRLLQPQVQQQAQLWLQQHMLPQQAQLRQPQQQLQQQVHLQQPQQHAQLQQLQVRRQAQLPLQHQLQQDTLLQQTQQKKHAQLRQLVQQLVQLQQPQQQTQQQQTQQQLFHQPLQQKQMSLRQMRQLVQQQSQLQEPMLQQQEQQQQELNQSLKQKLLQHLKERAEGKKMSLQQYACKLFRWNKERQAQSQQQHHSPPL